jgi:hypothetical protein
VARDCAQPLALDGATVTVPTTGRYELWIGGSVRGELTALVDGRVAGRLRHQLNHTGEYTSLGEVELTAGTHTVGSRQRLSRWRPGEGDEAWANGPLVVTPADRCV